MKKKKTYRETIERSEAEVSDILTYDEFIEEYTNNEGVSLEFAKERLFLSDNGLVSDCATTATYRIISDTLNVTADYKPRINFYCQVSEGAARRYCFDKQR